MSHSHMSRSFPKWYLLKFWKLTHERISPRHSKTKLKIISLIIMYLLLISIFYSKVVRRKLVLEANLVHTYFPIHWPELLVFHIKKDNKYFTSLRASRICKIKYISLLCWIRKSSFEILIIGLLCQPATS